MLCLSSCPTLCTQASAAKEQAPSAPRGGGIKLGKIKSGGTKSVYSKEELENLRTGIQKLVQSTNPLGKSMVGCSNVVPFT